VICILGSLLRQVVGGMERVPEEITRGIEEQKMDIGGQGPRLPDIVKMLQTITSSCVHLYELTLGTNAQ